jgi:hypothetical protein
LRASASAGRHHRRVIAIIIIVIMNVVTESAVDVMVIPYHRHRGRCYSRSERVRTIRSTRRSMAALAEDAADALLDRVRGVGDRLPRSVLKAVLIRFW